MNIVDSVKIALEKVSNPTNEPIMKKFFKAFPGGYGGEDNFLCIKNKDQRHIAKQYYKDITLNELSELLHTSVHEYRLCALIMLVSKYQKSKDPNDKEIIADFYLNHTDRINNWDLVDLSAHYILGDFLLDKDTLILIKLAKSNNLWNQRISIISTFAFIRKNKFDLTLKIAKILLENRHDLIHKAVGWMLREVGNRDLKTETDFLDENYKFMPRTMLRYAIEKFSEDLRLYYLKLK